MRYSRNELAMHLPMNLPPIPMMNLINHNWRSVSEGKVQSEKTRVSRICTHISGKGFKRFIHRLQRRVQEVL